MWVICIVVMVVSLLITACMVSDFKQREKNYRASQQPPEQSQEVSSVLCRGEGTGAMASCQNLVTKRWLPVAYMSCFIPPTKFLVPLL